MASTMIVTLGESMYSFSLLSMCVFNSPGLMPEACISCTRGNEMRPSGRTRTLRVKSGSFHTNTSRMSLGWITYRGTGLLTGAAGAASLPFCAWTLGVKAKHRTNTRHALCNIWFHQQSLKAERLVRKNYRGVLAGEWRENRFSHSAT